MTESMSHGWKAKCHNASDYVILTEIVTEV